MVKFKNLSSNIANKSENYEISKTDIISYLDNSNYKDNYEEITTYLEPGKIRWGREKRKCFEQSIENKGYMHFAYIKFYIGDNKEPYALVAGKTGSRSVNTSGTDIYFSYNTKKGESKEWLVKSNKKWHTTSVLAIKTFTTDKYDSRKEAFQIEKDICRAFSLKES